MSELKQSFKKALQAFTHAGDFIVPLYEDAYLIAEDISDEMAAERNLYEQDYETHQLIEKESRAQSRSLANSRLPFC